MTWYRPRPRAYPWRSRSRGALPDPYAVLVSELMLQQTQAAQGGAGLRGLHAALPRRALTGGPRLGPTSFGHGGGWGIHGGPLGSTRRPHRPRARRRGSERSLPLRTLPGSASTRRPPSRAWRSGAGRRGRHERSAHLGAGGPRRRSPTRSPPRAYATPPGMAGPPGPRLGTKRSWILGARSAGPTPRCDECPCVPGARSPLGTRRRPSTRRQPGFEGRSGRSEARSGGAARPVAPHVRRPLGGDRRAGERRLSPCEACITTGWSSPRSARSRGASAAASRCPTELRGRGRGAPGAPVRRTARRRGRRRRTPCRDSGAAR